MSWREVCEWVVERDKDLHAELVLASHVALVKQFTAALNEGCVRSEQLVHMFASVLCVDDIRWPYTLLNAARLSHQMQTDKEPLEEFAGAFKWLAAHAMFEAKLWQLRSPPPPLES